MFEGEIEAIECKSVTIHNLNIVYRIVNTNFSNILLAEKSKWAFYGFPFRGLALQSGFDIKLTSQTITTNFY